MKTLATQKSVVIFTIPYHKNVTFCLKIPTFIITRWRNFSNFVRQLFGQFAYIHVNIFMFYMFQGAVIDTAI